MTMKEKVHEFLFHNSNQVIKNKSSENIDSIAKIFNIKRSSALTYYYSWKQAFMGTSYCIPKSKKYKMVKINDKRYKLIEDFEDGKVRLKGKYGEYIKSKTGVKVGDVFFRTEEDIDKYCKAEIETFKRRLGEILDVLELEVTYSE